MVCGSLGQPRITAIQYCDLFDLLQVQNIFRLLQLSFQPVEAGDCLGTTMRGEVWHILVVFRTKPATGGYVGRYKHLVYLFAV